MNKFLAMVFGSQQGHVTAAISQQHGLSTTSVTGLLRMAAPLVMAELNEVPEPANPAASTREPGLFLRIVEPGAAT